MLEKSLQDKVMDMNYLGFCLSRINLQSDIELDDADSAIIWDVADGLSEKFVLDRVAGRCSFVELQKWGCEELEGYVDRKLSELKDIYFRKFRHHYCVLHEVF